MKLHFKNRYAACHNIHRYFPKFPHKSLLAATGQSKKKGWWVFLATETVQEEKFWPILYSDFLQRMVQEETQYFWILVFSLNF